MRIFKIWSLSNFKIYSAALLTIVATLRGSFYFFVYMSRAFPDWECLEGRSLPQSLCVPTADRDLGGLHGAKQNTWRCCCW